MVVDFQHHYVPEQLARKKGLYSDEVAVATEDGVPRMTLHAKLYDAKAQLRDMDEAGVDVSVLSCHLGWDGSLEDCRVINDSYAELERQYDGRFVGLAHAPVLEGDSALDELDRAILERGLHGVTITSQVGGLFLDSPELDPFYDRVARLDIPIFVHPALVRKGY
ncbi:MAG: amidohydrolase family protein, partial [Gammaproteobacteria bacterium]|nr:amidohydrolase family protein [Gammaproteobacteria bacterium]